MKKIGFIVFILSNLFLSGQNLVPNPSFKSYSNCPYTASQLSFATSWSSPTNADTDYFKIFNGILSKLIC